MRQRYALEPRFLDDLMHSTGRGMTLLFYNAPCHVKNNRKKIFISRVEKISTPIISNPS